MIGHWQCDGVCGSGGSSDGVSNVMVVNKEREEELADNAMEWPCAVPWNALSVPVLGSNKIWILNSEGTACVGIL